MRGRSRLILATGSIQLGSEAVCDPDPWAPEHRDLQSQGKGVRAQPTAAVSAFLLRQPPLN
jgi:hypothetical protein